LSGRYVFGDFGSGRIWHIARDAAATLQVNQDFDSGLQIAAFAEALDGELLVVNYADTLHRLLADSAAMARPQHCAAARLALARAGGDESVYTTALSTGVFHE
jgi:hypothetical protein